MLIDDRPASRRTEGDGWRSDEVARVAVPPTIQLLLAARLDRLDADERAVAERASVDGEGLLIGGGDASSRPTRTGPRFVRSCWP